MFWPEHDSLVKLLRATVSWIVVLCLWIPASTVCAKTTTAQTSKILLRLLSYDRKLDKRAGKKSATILVVHIKDNATAQRKGDAYVKALESLSKSYTLRGRQIVVKRSMIASAVEFDKACAGHSPVAAILISGLDDMLEAILKASRARSVLTFTDDEDFSSKGVAVAVYAQPRNTTRRRPYKLVINVTSMRAEGADFPAKVLATADRTLR